MIEGEPEEVFDLFDVDPMERVYDDANYPNFGDGTEEGREQRREWLRSMIRLQTEKEKLDLTQNRDKPMMPIKELLKRLESYPALRSMFFASMSHEDIEELVDSAIDEVLNQDSEDSKS